MCSKQIESSNLDLSKLVSLEESSQRTSCGMKRVRSGASVLSRLILTSTHHDEHFVVLLSSPTLWPLTVENKNNLFIAELTIPLFSSD